MTLTPTSTSRILILGGARDGKSAFAEKCASHFTSVCFFATARGVPGDDDLTARIRAHAERRPGHWQTLEPPSTLDDLEEHVIKTKPEAVIVDCLTLWLGWELTQKHSIYTKGQLQTHLDLEMKHLVRRLWALPCQALLMVSNEVGLGVVPSHESGRIFRDNLGVLNTLVATKAQFVCRMTAGQALVLKDEQNLQANGAMAVQCVSSAWMSARLKGQNFVP